MQAGVVWTGCSCENHVHKQSATFAQELFKSKNLNLRKVLDHCRPTGALLAPTKTSQLVL